MVVDTTIDGIPILAVAILSACDMVSGYLKARMRGDVRSRKMFEGIMHKAAYFMLITIFGVVQVMQGHFSIWPDFPTVTAVCTLICVTEIVSNLENIIAVNPDIADYDIVKKILGDKEL